MSVFVLGNFLFVLFVRCSLRTVNTDSFACVYFWRKVINFPNIYHECLPSVCSVCTLRTCINVTNYTIKLDLRPIVLLNLFKEDVNFSRRRAVYQWNVRVDHENTKLVTLIGLWWLTVGDTLDSESSTIVSAFRNKNVHYRFVRNFLQHLRVIILTR